MARPIEPTPKLNKKQSEEFIRRMIETENTPIPEHVKERMKIISEMLKI